MGISFFVFQAIAYLFDIYREEHPPEKNLLSFSLFITFFPQLIAGPIVRYQQVQDDLHHPHFSPGEVIEGTKRFLHGLSKKVLIANNIGIIAENILYTDLQNISPSSLWLGSVAYGLQIYFDFSGYSDMAIGIGKSLGFTFPENFNYPYIARSLQDFWRRWHISLSTWFRDYLYIPLGGSKGSKSRTLFNLFIVFAITGFWHGANYNFLIWGLFHGFFLIIERLGFKKVLSHLPRFFQHFYTLFIVAISWVIFMIEDFERLQFYFLKMFSLSNFFEGQTPLSFIDKQSFIAIIIGCLFSTPLFPLAERIIRDNFSKFEKSYISLLLSGLRNTVFASLFLLNLIYISGSTFNPFIYFRF